MKWNKLFFCLTVLAGFVFIMNLLPVGVFAHCEIPCGIYEDQLRIQVMEEDITTIEKSMKEIKRLSAEEDKDYHQIVRWIINKEDHANKMREVVTQYFMAQRLPLVEDKNSSQYQKYLTKLTLLHELVFYTMKAKQTTDLKYVEKMRDTLKKFEKAYFENQEKEAKEKKPEKPEKEHKEGHSHPH